MEPNGALKGEIVVRWLELDDLASVFHLGEKLFVSRTLPTAYRTWDEYEVVGFFKSDSNLCFVAEYDEQIIGFLLGSIIEKNRSAWSYGYLTWLGVDPDMKRCGVGDKLVKEFIDACRKEGVRMMLVDTESENKEALAFFHKYGFGNEEGHVFMTLNLTKTTGNGKKKTPKPPVKS